MTIKLSGTACQDNADGRINAVFTAVDGLFTRHRPGSGVHTSHQIRGMTMAQQNLSAEEQEALRLVRARARDVDQAMLENLFRKGLIKPLAIGGYGLKIEGRAALRLAA